MSDPLQHKRRFRRKNLQWLVGSLATTALGFYLSEIWKHSDSIGVYVLISSITLWIFFVLLSFWIMNYVRIADKREKTWHKSTKEREDAWLRTFGTPAELFYKMDEISQETYHDKLAYFIQQTSKGDEIFIMNHHGTKIDAEERNRQSEAHERYFYTLEQKVIEGVKYNRIICFDQSLSETVEAGYLRQYLINHCRTILILEKQHEDRIILKKSTTIFGEDIMLIMRKGKIEIAAITLDVHDPEAGSVHTESALIFHDPPDAKIIQQFASLFKRADKHGRIIKSISEQGQIS